MGTLATTLFVVAGAIAYLASVGAGASTATVGALPTPVIASATPGAGTVGLNWAPGVTAPQSGSVTYYVKRDGGNAAGCPTSSAPTGVTSCTDTNPATGSHSYTVTAVWRTWTATSAPRSTTPLSAPSVASISPSSRGQGAANQNVVIAGTGFVSGAVASFSCLCETGAQTPEQHGSFESIDRRAHPFAPMDVTAVVGRCQVCKRGWTFEASGDSHYSYSYEVHAFAS